MRSKTEIEKKITQIETDYGHVLTGSLATIQINAPRALMQMDAETNLRALHWVLGKQYKSKLKGRNT